MTRREEPDATIINKTNETRADGVNMGATATPLSSDH